ncbi:winged helix-turn-helix domain-containing protein [Halovivax gelatinilyticus]|uniref:winged helix-turn-helix domain-containing protein n=1 Tax=Halovivax gelatinilyticus TaxID=2961597 RepID=UPI0020CA3E14|nr:helix-turn-helix domain-containing protein [Halovivax gelatinilyticus]
MDDSPIVEVQDAEAAFSVLSDRTRIDILRALFDADDEPLTFAALRESVGIRDSGQFNYHLGKLTDGFVRKTDDGYELRSAGRNVIGALLAGSYTMAGSIDPIPLDEPCPSCEFGRSAGERGGTDETVSTGADRGTLTFDYEDDRVRIECSTCPFQTAFPLPPGALADHPVERYPHVADRYLRTLLAQCRNEFCSQCYAHVEPSFTTFDELSSIEPPTTFFDAVAVVYECDRCEMSTQANLSTLLLDHPLVSAFFLEFGIDVRDEPLWRMGAIAGEPRSTMLDDGLAEVSFVADDARLTLTVDDRLEVVDSRRSG